MNPAWGDLADLARIAVVFALVAIAAAHLIALALACGFNRARGGAKPW